MKKIIKISKILCISILLLNSCNRAEQTNKSFEPKFISKDDTNSYTNRFGEANLETFANDEILTSFRISYYHFLEASKNKELRHLAFYSEQGQELLNVLREKYGAENVTNYIDELKLREKNKNTDPQILRLEGSHDESSCTRNLDGTTYWDNCSFWEGAAAYVGILTNCGSVSAGDSMQAIENYYNCNQAQICKHC